MTPLVAALLALGPAEDQDILVQARKREEVKAQAREMVRALGSTPVQGQYARWNAPVCPGTLGVPAEIGRRVVARIRSVAADAGAPLAPETCKPNFIVTFTDDAPGLMARIARRSPRAIDAADPGERRELVTSPAPVRWWFGAEPEGADGQKLVRESAAGAAGAMMGGARELPGQGDVPALDSYSSKLATSYIRVSVTRASAVVDVNRASGRSLDAVADYVAMAGLGAIRFLPLPSETPSILRLFDDAGGPAELTAWDRAYLKAVYRIRPNLAANAQRGAMAEQMLRDLAP